jgi:4-hydroxy-tetrahydrodipicolinate reductase
MIGVCVAGPDGRLGRLACAAIEAADDLDLAATLRRGDDARTVLSRGDAQVLLDVSLAEASRALVPQSIAHGVSPVVGTSGLDPADIEGFAAACLRAGLGGLVVPNFSVGAVLQMQAARRAASLMPCDGIHEIHHPGKRDAPSGTARATAADMAAASGGEPPAITSERTEGVVARQDVRFSQPGERLLLVHEVTDRRAYLPGLLLALRRVTSLDRLHVGLDAVLGRPADPADPRP